MKIEVNRRDIIDRIQANKTNDGLAEKDDLLFKIRPENFKLWKKLGWYHCVASFKSSFRRLLLWTKPENLTNRS